ncbi:hypothetical protein DFA_00891 [Cavenderia fasciculata]|uniref:FNIP repeat-containing protein n=1 Tax=Cavenderia fasciculata TaxID=261658 RepID=F4PUF0_CACFS|nr:uncharacterized protein DFA_00891 [Cavenderia fasciculata]EGG21022.1 hypothetical protein DFA_00891 [Cavenderia fasciculata]|eukprot:XP_004358872.1 hypothetical protein DFA_00891 [Cavenderia fasciculata]
MSVADLYFKECSSLFLTNEPLLKSLKRFSLHSFKHLFNNALSNQMVLSDIINQKILPSFNSHLVNNNDKSTPSTDNISIFISTIELDDIKVPLPSTTTSIDITSQVNAPLPPTLLEGIDNLQNLYISTEYTSLERLCKLPDTLKSFTMYIDNPSCLKGDDVFPLGLERLLLSTAIGDDHIPIPLYSLGLEKLKSLKSLDITPVIITESLPLFLPSPSSPSSILPSSLTSLDIGIQGVLPLDFFQSLLSLRTLSLNMYQPGNNSVVLTLDLTHLHCLETFVFFPGIGEQVDASLIKLPLSSSLKTLYVPEFYKFSNLSTQFFPTTLTSLDMFFGPTDYETIQLPKSLTKLSLVKCPLSVGFIPDSVKILSISSHDERDIEILPGLIPVSVETLTLSGYDGPTTSDYLPGSIKSLAWDRRGKTQTLPSKLEKLHWRQVSDPMDLPLVFPPTIQHIECTNISLYPLPPSLTSLSCQFDTTCLIDNSYYSISKFNYQQQQQDNNNNNLLLLPLNLRKLKIKFNERYGHNSKFSFRLDEVINQTNVEKLSIDINGRRWFKATIKRLDKDNSKVLIVDNKSLFGGIISQSNNDNNNNNEYTPIYLHYKVDSNVDLICLLLTCKRLYYNIRQQYSSTLQFKHIKCFRAKGNQTNESLISFSLHSFKHLFNNALSNQIVVSDDNQTKLKSFNSHLLNNNNNNNDKSTPLPDNISLFITTNNFNDIIAPSTTTSIDITSKARTSRPIPSTLLEGIDNLQHLTLSSEYTSRERICKLPDTLKSFTMYYNNPGCIEGDDMFPLGLETLSIPSKAGEDDLPTTSLNSLGLEKLKSLKELIIGPVLTSPSSPSSILPSSLTSLDIEFRGDIPSDLFQSLVSLRYLHLSQYGNDKSLALDLTNLHRLNTFVLFPGRIKLLDVSFINLPLSSSLKTILISGYYQKPNLSTQFFPTTLTSLSMFFGPTDYETIKLPMSLTYLHLQCKVPAPSGFIPDSVKTLSMTSTASMDIEILPLSIPSSVETLTLFGYEGPTTSEYLPDSIKELDWNRQIDTTTLPPKLETLRWGHIPKNISCVFPSTIQHLDYSDVSFFPLPPSLTSLSCQFDQTCLVNLIDQSYYSISKFNYKQQQKDGQLLLPLNLRKLKIKIRSNKKGTNNFRLDEVINQTNIEELSIALRGKGWLKATIKRLDKDNSRVLIVDNKSLFGGIIHQSRQSNNNNNNQYSPIYLYKSKEIDIPYWSHTTLPVN